MKALPLVTLLALTAAPVAAQSIRRGIDLADSNWAQEHAVIRCDLYRTGSSWGDALTRASSQMYDRTSWREARAYYNAGDFQGALDQAAARTCRMDHIQAWQDFSGEIAP